MIEVAAGAQPFRVTRFDPINLFVLKAGEVVHPRYIALEGPNGTVNITNPSYARGTFAGIVALTRAAGRHPLNDGILSLTLVGLRAVPTIERPGDSLVIEGDGVRIAAKNAIVHTEGETLRITFAS